MSESSLVPWVMFTILFAVQWRLLTRLLTRGIARTLNTLCFPIEAFFTLIWKNKVIEFDATLKDDETERIESFLKSGYPGLFYLLFMSILTFIEVWAITGFLN